MVDKILGSIQNSITIRQGGGAISWQRLRRKLGRGQQGFCQFGFWRRVILLNQKWEAYICNVVLVFAPVYLSTYEYIYIYIDLVKMVHKKAIHEYLWTSHWVQESNGRNWSISPVGSSLFGLRATSLATGLGLLNRPLQHTRLGDLGSCAIKNRV